ncbi:MAG: SRPBCC family protein [Phycisphaerales bacterium]|nr:SRPBCC family protein [Phycisphaerales bacterium]
MTHTNTDQIRQQIEILASPARVWEALADSRKFGEWFRVRLESPFVPGEHSRGNITHPGYEHVVMDILIHQMEPERRFSFFWHPYAIEAGIDYSAETPTLVEFTLEPTAKGTRLTVTESGFNAIPAARRDLAFRMNNAGWAAQMEQIDRYVTQASPRT